MQLASTTRPWNRTAVTVGLGVAISSASPSSEAAAFVDAASAEASAEASADEEDSAFATSMFADERATLWPIDLQVDIVPLDHQDDAAGVHREVVISGGQWTSLQHVVQTPTGLDAFDLELTAHHHARGAIEIEYDLAVRETPYERTTVGAYVLHRLALGPRPELGRPRLRAARADIVTTRGTPVRSQVTIGHRRYEIRLAAAKLRG